MLPFDPQKPLYGFTARAPHAKRRIHLFDGGEFLYFRPKNAPVDWWGVFWSDYPASWAAHNKEWEFIERHLCPHLKQSQIWRVFEMPDPRAGKELNWRIIWRSDFGFIETLEPSEFDCYGTYFWPQSARLNLWKTNTRDLRCHFEREWYDCQSDVRKALSWSELSREERGLRGIHWQIGSLEELESLLRASFCLLQLWNDTEEHHRVEIHLQWNESRQLVMFNCPFEWRQNSNWQRWQKLWRRIEQKNKGIYTAEGNRADWKFDWIKYESPRDWPRCSHKSFEVASPTQHERMEAALLLRDWLGNNSPNLLDDWF